MKKTALSIALSAITVLTATAKGDASLDSLMERLSPGLSEQVTVKLSPDNIDNFCIEAPEGHLLIRANNRVSAATGLNYYLRHYAHVQPAWDCMRVSIPMPLPLPDSSITRSTNQTLRYYLNYCTHSYSMPFWDKQRWQKEIDWMALHGINAALTITGTDAVWDATLRELGYPEEKADSFIAAPAYQAWWLMNNLEGEGAPMIKAQLDRQAGLQQFIIQSMRDMDIEPVFPGYSGMVPHDSRSELGLEVADPGKWCGYNRPAFLLPTDTAFARVARTYYNQQLKLFGKAKYYSMDPFHEGGNTQGVDLYGAAKAIERAMTEASPESKWLIQGWQENPRTEILRAISPERLTVLDLHAETVPQWNQRGFSGHPWVWCMLLNFGGNIGLHGKLDYIAEAFDAARTSPTPPCGIGLTMEGIENNPVMYELMCDLPWQAGKTDTRKWLKDYALARYGSRSEAIDSAWSILAGTIYGADGRNLQQGTTESVFCARPSDNPVNASAWVNSEPYYDGRQVIIAANLFARDADKFSSNPHYVYDLIDITRQAVAEAGRLEAQRFSKATALNDSTAYRSSAEKFLKLIALQDSLLSTLPHFAVSTWLNIARACAAEPALADDMERDARTLITTWGSRNASENGKLHDYAHREWAGLLKDFYAKRWAYWFSERLAHWNETGQPAIDFYTLEQPWTLPTGHIPPAAKGNPVGTARHALHRLNTEGYAFFIIER